MSWRVLILFLVLAGAASWQGGLQLGEWLVARAPETVTSVAQKDYKALTLDASGRPITPQPPQPRIDGTLGVPRELPTIEWAIEALIASNFDTDPNAMKVGDEEDDAEQTEGSETADARRLLGGTKLLDACPEGSTACLTDPPSCATRDHDHSHFLATVF